jgi:hypothetical protein
MYRVIQCETSNTFDSDIQSGYKYPNGKREQSFGLAQIHLPDHPHISRTEAISADFALNFMASEFQAGRKWKWSCWKLLQSKVLAN